MKPKDALGVALLTAAALAIQGYHPGAEDAEIYGPLVKRLLDPSLFTTHNEFFLPYSRVTLYPQLIAASVRISHLPFEGVAFLWYLAALFLILAAGWYLGRNCFSSEQGKWAAAGLLTVMLTIPVAGTSLYIADQYLNPRNLSAFPAIFAIADALERKYFRVALWGLFAAAIHPLMAVFAISFVAVLIWLREFRGSAALAAVVLPFGIVLGHPSAAYREAVRSRSYLFLLKWEWYEWIGIVGPFLLLWWFSRLARRHGMENLNLLCRAALIFEAVYLAIGAAITIPDRFFMLALYQPMRSLLIVYVVLLISAGGLLGQFVLKQRWGLWVLLFLPLAVGMSSVQRRLFPASPHMEWPGAAPNNDWLKAFAWVRTNTPHDAVFALNPAFLRLPGEDHHGFRALAERSRLADTGKDGGASGMFPALPMAEHWVAQTEAQRGWRDFQARDFERLRRDWGVTWVVVEQPNSAGLNCPYQNQTVLVCRVN